MTGPGSFSTDGLRRRSLFVLAAAVAVVHGGLLWLYYRPVQKVLWGDENTYVASARALLNGDPGWRPDPLWPALYPRFLAGLMAVGGGTLLVQIIQTILLGIVAVILGDLVRRIAGSQIAGCVAGTLVLLYPPLVGFSHFLWAEVLHLLLFVITLWLLAVKSNCAGWCGVAGVALGLALLTKSLLVPFVPVLLAAAFFTRPAGRALARAAVFLVAVRVTIGPTVIDQHRRTGRLMIDDSSAFNLWVGLNDTARRNFEVDVVSGAYVEYAKSGATFLERDAELREKIRGRLKGQSLPGVIGGQLDKQYFRLFDKDSYLTDQLPGGFAVERYRAGYLRAGPISAAGVRAVSYSSYGLLLFLAPFGFVVWRFKDRKWVAVLLLFVGYNLAIFLLFHVKTRFWIQLLPVFFMGAGAAVAYIGTRLAERELTDSIPRWRWTLALVVALGLELLAFGGRWLP